MTDTPAIILGIDPGLASTGVGIIGSDGHGGWRRLHSAHVITAERHPIAERLGRIHALVRDMIAQWQPTAVAIESIFFAKNVRSAVLMAHGRGAAILAAGASGLPVAEYSPLEIKQSVVGKGRASKDQVQHLVGVLLGLQQVPRSDHETDALACALCHAFRAKLLSRASVSAPRRQRGPSVDVPATDASYERRKELLAQMKTGSRRRRR